MRCQEQWHNNYSRYSNSGKSDICDKNTEYSAYARCQCCLGYPSIRSPAAILSSFHRPIHRTDRRYSHSRSVLKVTSHHLFSQQDHCPMRALIALASAYPRSAWYPQKRVVGFEISCVKFSMMGFFFDSWPAETVSRVSEILLFLVYES